MIHLSGVGILCPALNSILSHITFSVEAHQCENFILLYFVPGVSDHLSTSRSNDPSSLGELNHTTANAQKYVQFTYHLDGQHSSWYDDLYRYFVR